MKIPLRTLLAARRQALRKAKPKGRDQARQKVRVLELVQALRKEGRA